MIPLKRIQNVIGILLAGAVAAYSAPVLENPKFKGAPDFSGVTNKTAIRADIGIPMPSTSTATIYVSKNSAATDTRTAGDAADPAKPFATVAAAYTAAEALSPSASAPVLISVGPGVFSETASITWDTSDIALEGEGTRATTIAFTSTNALNISAARTRLANVHLTRSGGNAARVLHMTGAGGATPSLAGWIADITLENVRVSNPGGTAIGTHTAHSKGLLVDDCSTGIEQNYGGILDYPTIIAAKYAVRYSQSCAAHSSQPFGSTHPAIFNNPHLVQTDVTGGHVIQGLVEATTMDQVTTTDINWYGTRINSGKLHSACVVIPGTAATSETVRGCVHLFGVGVDGDRFTTYWFDSYATACYWSAQNYLATTVMSGVDNCAILGGVMNHSNTVKAFTFLNNTVMHGVTFEQDSIPMLGFEQKRLLDCKEIATGTIGWQRQDLTARVTATTEIMETAATLNFTGMTNCTIEAWIKLKVLDLTVNGNEDTGVMALVTAGGLVPFYIAQQRVVSGGAEVAASRQTYGGFGGNCGYTNTANALLNGSSANAQSAVANAVTGPYADGWHHVAYTYTTTSTTQKLWIDGVNVTTTTNGVTIPATAVRLVLGGYTSNGTPGTSLAYPLKGMIRAVRISDTVRYAGTFTPAVIWQADANTVALYGETTTGPLVWQDKIGRSNVVLNANTPPRWVPKSYTP